MAQVDLILNFPTKRGELYNVRDHRAGTGDHPFSKSRARPASCASHCYAAFADFDSFSDLRYVLESPNLVFQVLSNLSEQADVFSHEANEEDVSLDDYECTNGNQRSKDCSEK